MEHCDIRDKEDMEKDFAWTHLCPLHLGLDRMLNNENCANILCQTVICVK
ncbi:hypothetical protein CsSME_00000637 [Camellia sinensis var. sinensis]